MNVLPHQAWFRDARFGMFIHLGLYSVLGRHEWAMNNERIPPAEYDPLADRFNPEPGCARTWARMAKAAGMRYAVLTTKHHEGYCLWDSQICEHNAVRRGPGRDLVAEFVAACRAEGLKVGLYYSLMDWRHPDGTACAHDEAARQRFVRYTHGLVRELMSNYGQIDVLWYDINWPLDGIGMESAALNAMVRRLQPGILINDRSGIPQDFTTPEQKIEPVEGRLWEACLTFTEETWGHSPLDTRYKDANDVLRLLRQVARQGGNLLLNINPEADGRVPMPIRRALDQVGAWMERHGETIYHAADPMVHDHSLYGAFTRQGNTAFFHVERWPGDRITIGGFGPKVLAARIRNGASLAFRQIGDRLILEDLPERAPDPLATVIELACDGVPSYCHGPSPLIIDAKEPWKLHCPAGFTPVMGA
jgi:alpha-L-fucosidase